MPDVWTLMEHWDLVLPPSRPSAVQLARIKAQIRHVDRAAPVAVLGSTPEFRDLLVESGFKNIYVLEKNPSFLSAMSYLRVYQNTEQVIDGDWLETLPMLKGTFALILSDLTSGNIPYDIRPEFYGFVAGALFRGGLFCDKVLTHPGDHIPISTISEKYSQLPLNLLYANCFSCEALFCSELLELKHVVDSSVFYAILSRQIKDKRVLAFAKYAEKITPPGCRWWYGRRWHELSAEYCRDLEMIAQDDDEPGSPYQGRLQFFLHLKK